MSSSNAKVKLALGFCLLSGTAIAENIVKSNLLINGDFQSPLVETWKIFPKNSKEMQGWQGHEIQIGKAKFYNNKWDKSETNQVAEMDSKNNVEMTQSLNLKKGLYTLSLNYAAREGKDHSTSQLQVYWNGNLVKEVAADDYEVKKISFDVHGKDGENTLLLKGSGPSDSYGITVDNVVLLPSENQQTNASNQADLSNQKIETTLNNLTPNSISNSEQPKALSIAQPLKINGIKINTPVLTQQTQKVIQNTQTVQSKKSQTKTNLLINGDFQSPLVETWKIFPKNSKEMQGWQGHEIQIGKAKFYNNKWDKSETNQVAEMDSKNNVEMTQSLNLKKGLYTLSLNYAAREGKDHSTSQLQVYWNGNLVKEVAADDYEVKKISFDVHGKDGENTLLLKGSGPSDSYGITVDNVVLLPSENQQTNASNQADLSNQKIETTLNNLTPNSISNSEQPKALSIAQPLKINGIKINTPVLTQQTEKESKAIIEQTAQKNQNRESAKSNSLENNTSQVRKQDEKQTKLENEEKQKNNQGSQKNSIQNYLAHSQPKTLSTQKVGNLSNLRNQRDENQQEVRQKKKENIQNESSVAKQVLVQNVLQRKMPQLFSSSAVPLLRKVNYIKNGQFEESKHSEPFTGEITSWESQFIQIGPGKLYNEKWDSQVVKIGNNAKQVLRQAIDLAPGLYELSFDWSNVNSNQGKGQVEVFWNNRLIASLRGNSSKIQREVLQVKPCPCCGGRNTLEFRSSLDSNQNALSIDNVALTEVRTLRPLTVQVTV